MTFGHKLMHWPIVTQTYIEKFDSARSDQFAGQQISDVSSLRYFICEFMTFGHKLSHWLLVTQTYIEKFDSALSD